LPPRLRYVSTLPDITEKNETRHWRAEAEAHLGHLRHIPQGIIEEDTDQWQIRLAVCMCGGKGTSL